MQDYQAEQTRPPEGSWWEYKDQRFSREMYQSRLQAVI